MLFSRSKGKIMATVYQASDGQWIVYNNGIKTYFANEAEAMIMSEKIKFAEEVQAFSNEFSALVEKTPMFQSVYADREYGSGLADEILDADIESLGITAVELAAFITPFANQLFNFMNNLTVTAGDFSVTLNKLRTDI